MHFKYGKHNFSKLQHKLNSVMEYEIYTAFTEIDF